MIKQQSAGVNSTHHVRVSQPNTSKDCSTPEWKLMACFYYHGNGERAIKMLVNWRRVIAAIDLQITRFLTSARKKVHRDWICSGDIGPRTRLLAFSSLKENRVNVIFNEGGHILGGFGHDAGIQKKALDTACCCWCNLILTPDSHGPTPLFALLSGYKVGQQ